jgi:drug/metabolite transporter (DMT)-like permease
MQFWIGLLASIFTLIIFFVAQSFEIEALDFKTFQSSTSWLLLCLALITLISQLLVSKALYYANASLLASFQYLEIISATFLGWFIFHDIPDKLTVFGACIVIFSGIYLINIERKKRPKV